MIASGDPKIDNKSKADRLISEAGDWFGFMNIPDGNSKGVSSTVGLPTYKARLENGDFFRSGIEKAVPQPSGYSEIKNTKDALTVGAAIAASPIVVPALIFGAACTDGQGYQAGLPEEGECKQIPTVNGELLRHSEIIIRRNPVLPNEMTPEQFAKQVNLMKELSSSTASEQLEKLKCISIKFDESVNVSACQDLLAGMEFVHPKGKEGLGYNIQGAACVPRDPEATDTDDDKIPDTEDNCPELSNDTQVDTDGDGIGDACDVSDDEDGDEKKDIDDNCPLIENLLQEDADKDGIGDACDDEDGANPSANALRDIEFSIPETGLEQNDQLERKPMITFGSGSHSLTNARINARGEGSGIRVAANVDEKAILRLDNVTIKDSKGAAIEIEGAGARLHMVGGTIDDVSGDAIHIKEKTITGESTSESSVEHGRAIIENTNFEDVNGSIVNNSGPKGVPLIAINWSDVTPASGENLFKGAVDLIGAVGRQTHIGDSYIVGPDGRIIGLVHLDELRAKGIQAPSSNGDPVGEVRNSSFESLRISGVGSTVTSSNLFMNNAVRGVNLEEGGSSYYNVKLFVNNVVSSHEGVSPNTGDFLTNGLDRELSYTTYDDISVDVEQMPAFDSGASGNVEERSVNVKGGQGPAANWMLSSDRASFRGSPHATHCEQPGIEIPDGVTLAIPLSDRFPCDNPNIPEDLAQTFSASAERAAGTGQGPHVGSYGQVYNQMLLTLTGSLTEGNDDTGDEQ